MQLYIKLRAAIFAEDGYCLNAPPLRKDESVYLRKMGSDGLAAVLEPIDGCTGTSARTVCVTLADYPAPDKARSALLLMCKNLGGALDGDAEARAAVAAGWQYMLFSGLKMTEQPSDTQLAILMNLYGSDRVDSQVARFGSFAGFAEPDWPTLLDEALPALAHAMH